MRYNGDSVQTAESTPLSNWTHVYPTPRESQSKSYPTKYESNSYDENTKYDLRTRNARRSVLSSRESFFVIILYERYSPEITVVTGRRWPARLGEKYYNIYCVWVLRLSLLPLPLISIFPSSSFVPQVGRTRASNASGERRYIIIWRRGIGTYVIIT